MNEHSEILDLFNNFEFEIEDVYKENILFDELFKGKRFSVTGSLSVLRKEFVAYMIYNYGMIWDKIPVSGTDFIFVPTDFDKTTSKLKSAIRQGTQIIEESYINDIIEKIKNNQK